MLDKWKNTLLSGKFQSRSLLKLYPVLSASDGSFMGSGRHPGAVWIFLKQSGFTKNPLQALYSQRLVQEAGKIIAPKPLQIRGVCR